MYTELIYSYSINNKIAIIKIDNDLPPLLGTKPLPIEGLKFPRTPITRMFNIIVCLKLVRFLNC